MFEFSLELEAWCLELSLLAPIFLDDFVHGRGIGGFFERLAKFFFVKQLGDAGEGVEVFLELALGNEEKHDEVDGLVVEGVEIHAALGTAKSADDFLDEVRGGVRDADAETDARAHGGFAFLDDGGNGVAVFGLDFAGGDEVVDQLVDGQPAVGSLQFRQDIIGTQNVAKIHSAKDSLVISP